MDIIILHGWGSSPERWDQVQEELAEHVSQANVHIPYVPGFDPKEPPKKPLTIDSYVDWLNNYIHRKKLHKPVLVGHSNGGRIGIHFAAKYPKTLSKLVLVGASGIQPRNSVKKLVFGSIAKAGKTVVSAIGIKDIEKISQKLLYKLTGERDYHKASPIMKKTMVNMLAYDARTDLHDIETPTLCIWGSEDKSTPLWMGKEIRDGIAHAHLEQIPRGGHNIHRTHPVELGKLLMDFIS